MTRKTIEKMIENLKFKFVCTCVEGKGMLGMSVCGGGVCGKEQNFLNLRKLFTKITYLLFGKVQPSKETRISSTIPP